RSENISPWLALAGKKGSGSFTLTGSAQGNLTDLKSRGALKVANLNYDKLAVKSGAFDFALARTAQQAIPGGDVVARLSGVQAGVELQKLEATAKFGAASRSASIDLKAQDQAGRFHTLQTNVDYSQADIVATLKQASFNLPDGMWSLAAPATLSKRGETFNIQKLTLRNGAKTAALDGQIAMTGAQGLNLTVDQFPLEGLAAFLPKQPTMNGLLALRAQVGGTAAAPEIAGTINLTDAKIGGQSYAGLAADLNYRERQANLNLTVRQDATHTLTAAGRLPLLLSWHDGWRSDVTGDMNLRVQSAGLSLAFLNAYTAKTVSDVAGEISLDLTARGRPAAPALSGSFRLSDGKLRATLLNVPVDSVSAEGSFDARVIRIQKLSARANDGTFSGSGLLTLQNYQIDNFKLSLAARRWPAIDTRRYRARIGGTVEIDGSPAAPRITGKIDITEADLRPDLAFLEQSSTAVKRDETIVVVNRDGSERVAPVKTNSNNGLGDSELFKALTVDLTLRMPSNVRVRHPDASAELRGNIHATKKPGQALQLIGNSEIIRGWAAFQGRRFDIVRGDIQFIGGGKIDPALDILAQHRLPQYTVEALVGGTVEKPSLALRSNPSLDQADILALLVFGKPTKDLNSSEQVSLKQNALDVTTGFAAANMGAVIAEALGLESLGVGDINFTGGRVGLGRYLGRRTYVTVNQELAGERGQQASVEVQLAPDWKIGSSTTSTGSSEVEVIWHKRY
ncbi:MAG: translocation/assembly module TamB domain-containing protein, partial [Candidatus Binatia bacterium]